MGDGKVVYNIIIDDSNVEKDAEAAGRKAGSGVEKGAQSGTSAFKEMMIGAARAIGEAFVEMAQKAVQGVEQIVKAGIDFNAKMEQYQTGLTTLLGSEEQAVNAMEQIRKDAANTPFDVDSLTQANQMLISTGMSAEDARGDVLNLANAIAATGGGSAELSRMAANMQQIKNVGKATAMDIRQFAMAGINIYGLLADATGKTTEEVKDMEVSYELLSEALAKAAEEGGAYEGAMEAQSQTFNGRISTLKDNATQLAGALTEDIFTQLSDTALPQVMDWVATLLDAAQTGGVEGALAAARSILSALVDQFMAAWPDMAASGLQLITQLLTGITDSLPRLGSVAKGIVLGLLQALISQGPDLLAAGVTLFTEFLTGLSETVVELLPFAIEAIQTLLGALIENAPKLLAAALTIISTLAHGLIDNLPQLLEAAVQLLGRLVTAFIDGASQLLPAGKQMVDSIWQGVAEAWGAFVGWVQDLWDGIKAIFSGGISTTISASYMGPDGNVNAGAMPGGEYATGLDYVPYDEFPARLHHGEAVLTAAEAASWRAMERNVSFNLSATGPAQQIVVPLYLDGREVARASAWAMGEQLAWEEI